MGINGKKVLGLMILIGMIIAEIIIFKHSGKNDETVKAAENTTEAATEMIQEEPATQAKVTEAQTEEKITQEKTTERYEDTEEVTEAPAEVKKPVNLMDLEMLSGSPEIFGSTEINTGERVNGIGVTFDGDIEPGGTLHSPHSPSYAVYNEYKYFSCKLALLNDCSKNSQLECYIKIYGDDEDEPFYTSPRVSAGSLPAEISNVDISGYDKILIRFTIFNPLGYTWQSGMWSLDFYPISWMIYDAEFSN